MIMKAEFSWPTGSENTYGFGKFRDVFFFRKKFQKYPLNNQKLAKNFYKLLFFGSKSYLFAGLVEYRIFGNTLFSV